MEHYNKHKQFPSVKITLFKFSKSIKDGFHAKNLERSFRGSDKGFKITAYDKEIYKFEHMLDEYQNKFNAQNIDLGRISVNPITYTWITESIEKGVKRYYREFFDINSISIKNKKMKILVKEYIKGWVWVFNQYYNSFSQEDDNKYGDIWYYPYLRAPLLSQVYYYMRDNIDDKKLLYIENTKVNMKNYFNPYEHLMYVSPANEVLAVIPHKYHKFAKSKYYPDINKIAKHVVNKKDNDDIDCRGIIFLNKCHIHDRVYTNKISDKEFIYKLRKIK